MDNTVTKTFAAEIKTSGTEGEIAGIFNFSDEVDLYDEAIHPRAFEESLDKFKRNAPLLWSHSHQDLPLGIVTDLSLTPSGLKGRAKLAVKENEKAATIWKMIKAGYGPRAFSVGFVPREYETDYVFPKDHALAGKKVKRFYTKADLLEVSLCNLGASRSSIITDKSLKREIDDGELKLFCSTETGKCYSEEEVSEAIDELLGDIITKPEVGDEYVHIPVKDADLFLKTTFRTIDIDKDNGIKAVVGKLKSDGPTGKTQVQKYMFLIEAGWDLESATQWVKQHHKKAFNEWTLEDVDKFLSDNKDRLDRYKERKLKEMAGRVFFEDDDDNDLSDVEREVLSVAKKTIDDTFDQIKGGKRRWR
jgi:HK97 family phage prohead protease